MKEKRRKKDIPKVAPLYQILPRFQNYLKTEIQKWIIRSFETGARNGIMGQLLVYSKIQEKRRIG